MKQLIKTTPIPLAGLALGVIALGGLLKGFSPVVYWFCFALSVLLVAMVIAHVALFTDETRTDMRNPMIASTSGTLSMALMQISVGLNAVAPQAAFVLWLIAVAGHTVLIIWFTATFVPHFEWGKLMPSWFIVYVGILMIAATGTTFGLDALAQVLFWIGLTLCLVLMVLVAYRMRAIPLPEPAMPMVCIFAAPFSLGLTVFLTANVQPNTAFAFAMIVLAQMLYFFVIFQLPKLFKLLHGRFFPSVAAMTFPFVISATALNRMCAFLANSGIAFLPFLNGLALVETVLAIALVMWAFVRYVMFFAAKAKNAPGK